MEIAILFYWCSWCLCYFFWCIVFSGHHTFHHKYVLLSVFYSCTLFWAEIYATLSLICLTFENNTNRIKWVMNKIPIEIILTAITCWYKLVTEISLLEILQNISKCCSETDSVLIQLDVSQQLLYKCVFNIKNLIMFSNLLTIGCKFYFMDSILQVFVYLFNIMLIPCLYSISLLTYSSSFLYHYASSGKKSKQACAKNRAINIYFQAGMYVPVAKVHIK